MPSPLPVVIPAAGRGSRVGRLTRSTSKELLPLGDDVTLSHVLAELEEAGVEDVLLVGRPDKADLGAYVDQVRRENRFRLRLEITNQGEVPGNGGAVLTAAAVLGARPFVVVWGDEVFLGPSRTGQLLAAYEALGAPCLCLCPVTDADVPKCGIVEGRPDPRGCVRVDRILEKPPLAATASRSASVGGFVLEPHVVEMLGAMPRAADGELYLSAALDAAARKSPLFGVPVQAAWYETGSYRGYAQAFSAVARARGLLD